MTVFTSIVYEEKKKSPEVCPYANVPFAGLGGGFLQRVAGPHVVRIHAVAALDLLNAVGRRQLGEASVEGRAGVDKRRRRLVQVVRRLRAAFHGRTQHSRLS